MPSTLHGTQAPHPPVPSATAAPPTPVDVAAAGHSAAVAPGPASAAAVPAVANAAAAPSAAVATSASRGHNSDMASKLISLTLHYIQAVLPRSPTPPKATDGQPYTLEPAQVKPPWLQAPRAYEVCWHEGGAM